MIHCLPRKTMLYPHKSFSILFPAEFWRSNVARCGFSNTCVLPAQLLSTHVFYSLVLHVESSNVQATHEKDLKLSAGHSKCSLKNVWTYLHNIRTFLVCHLECYPHSNSGGDYGWFQNNHSRDLWYHIISVIMDDHHPKRLFSSRIAGIAIKYMQNHHFGHLQ